jgi:hypothetical protein
MLRPNGRQRGAGKPGSVSLAMALVIAVAPMVVPRTAAAQPVGAQGKGAPPPPARGVNATNTARNPAYLHATEELGPVVVGAGRRVRFEWEPVLGCTQYVLTGQWTDGRSWALHSSEYRVTTRNASSWQARRVTFDVSLPEGNHSWKLVAVFGPNDAGDFERPAQLSFDVK